MAIAVSPPSRHRSPRCYPLTFSRHPFLPLSLQALYTLLSSWWLCIGAFAICGTWGFAYGMRREAASLDIAGVPVPKPLACGGASLLLMLLTGMISAFAYAAAHCRTPRSRARQPIACVDAPPDLPLDPAGAGRSRRAAARGASQG